MISKSNKKGNATVETLLVVVLLFVFSVLGVVGYQIFDDMNADIQASSDVSDTGKDLSSDLFSRYPAFIDNAFLVVFVLLWALALVASFMIDSHPIFFIFTFLLLLAVFYVGAILSNVFNELMADGALASASTNFPIINFIMGNILPFLVAVGFTVMIAMFGKSRLQE